MGKKELQWTPLLGQYMTLSGAVFVDRRNNARAVQSLRAAADAVRVQAMSLWMFPEGTRSMRAESDMLPFKKGAFHLAVQAGVPIIPVVCENYWRLYRQGVFESGVLTIRGEFPCMRCRHLPLTSSAVLPPIPTAGMKEGEVGALANRVREAMVTALREISEPAPDAGAAPPASASGARATSPPAEPRTVIDERVTPKPSTPPAPSSSSVASSISIPPSPAPSDSHESIASSTASLAGRRRPESDAGFETEEDEGMVLVGRPPR
jgi:lysophosphatidate acyltransferase